MYKNLTFTNSKGDGLAAILNETGNKEWIVIMAHGFTSNKNTKNFVMLADMLGEVNIPTFLFDFWGHGDSEGKFEDITVTEAVDDILNAVKFVKKLGYQKIGLLGSSFGGISSTMSASKTDELSFLMLKSPVSDFWEVEKNLLSEKELDEWKQNGYRPYEDGGTTLRLGWSFAEDFKNNDAYAAATKIKIPTLIVHGKADETVPYSQSEKLASLIAGSQLVGVSGADHRYTVEEHSKIMRDSFYDFAKEQIGKN